MKDSEVEKTEGAYVFQTVWRTYRALLARSDGSKKRLNICDSDFRVLEALLHRGPLAVNVLGEMVDLTTGSITSAIDRLEEKRLVIRENHDSDRRIRMVELTAKGKRMIEKAFARHKFDLEDAVGTLSRQERLVLVKLLERVRGANEGLTG